MGNFMRATWMRTQMRVGPVGTPRQRAKDGGIATPSLLRCGGGPPAARTTCFEHAGMEYAVLPTGTCGHKPPCGRTLVHKLKPRVILTAAWSVDGHAQAQVLGL